MTAIEFLEINGLNSIPYRQDVLDVMKEFAIYCCEKQREICADGSERLWIANNYCQIDQMCNTIIYSPLPKELQ